MADLMRRMHYQLRRSPAPYLRAFLRTMEHGIRMISLRGFAASLYLNSATEDALREWADTYGIEPGGLSDAELRESIRTDALTRGDTTEAGIEAAILRYAGARAAVRPTLKHVAAYDEQERMQQGYRMADYGQWTREERGIKWGGTWGGPWPSTAFTVTEDDPTHLGYLGLTPRREGYGPEGFIVYLAQPYDAGLEARVLAVLERHAPAMSGYSLFWAHTFERQATDTLELPDRETQVPVHGWGCAPFGRPWGSPGVTAEACPDPQV